MAQTKVSALTELTSPDGSEELLVNDGGTSKKVTIDNLLYDESIDSDHYVDGSIDNAHLADDAVRVDELSATGSASSSTFLRGDNAWATPTDTDTTYSNFTGDSGSGGAAGLVPAPGAGDTAAGKYLDADGSFTVPPDTDTNTTYTAGDLLDLDGTEFDVDLSELTDGTADVVGSADELVYLDDGSQKRKQIDEIKLGQFNNDQSWTANAGTMTEVLDDTTPQLGGFLDVNGNYIQTEKGADIASASPTIITTVGDYFNVTGTTNFAAFTVAADRQFTLQFDGILTMTHHATNLDLPGEANITTAAGDVATFQSTAANQVQCINYTRADGTAIVGASGVTVGFYEHTHTISEDLSITTDYNALSASPITIASGYSVTVPSGSTWVIV